jgi:hypothetical protein
MIATMESKRIFNVVIASHKPYPPSEIIWNRMHLPLENANPPVEFKEFVCVYEVQPTGIQLGARTIETKVLGRLKNK